MEKEGWYVEGVGGCCGVRLCCFPPSRRCLLTRLFSRSPAKLIGRATAEYELFRDPVGGVRRLVVGPFSLACHGPLREKGPCGPAILAKTAVQVKTGFMWKRASKRTSLYQPRYRLVFRCPGLLQVHPRLSVAAATMR